MGETLVQKKGPNCQERNQPKEEVFGPDIPRTSGGHSRGYPGPKLRSGPSKSWKKKPCIWARTSMTRRRRRPRPQGIFQNFGQKNFGLNFRSLNWGQVNFPLLNILFHALGVVGRRGLTIVLTQSIPAGMATLTDLPGNSRGFGSKRLSQEIAVRSSGHVRSTTRNRNLLVIRTNFFTDRLISEELKEGCGGLGGENPAAFPQARPIFQQPFSLLENAQTLAGIEFRAAGKSVKNFPAASKFARKLYQPGISDSHSLLEFSDDN